MYEVFEQLLQKFDITAYKVSKEVGVSQAMLSDWKRGRSTPKTDNMQKIADYFGVTIDYLMTGKEVAKKRNATLTARDERDIAKDMEKLREKLKNKEDGPASFDGKDLSDDSAELLLTQIESMLRTIKVINKEKYNPYKNKEEK